MRSLIIRSASKVAMRYLPRSLARGLACASFSSASTSSSSSSPSPSVVACGLGHMGLPMAVSLLRGKVSIVAVDPSDESVRSLQEAAAQMIGGAAPPPTVTRAPTPRAALTDNGVVAAVVTMLPATRHVREVYEHPRDGLLVGLEELRKRHSGESRNGSSDKRAPSQQPSRRSPHGGGAILFLECSTSSPSFSRQLAARVPAPHLYVGAPVSGGVSAARASALTFMCGGGDAALLAAQPLLSLMGARSVRCGRDGGAGHAAKVCNNLAMAVQYAGVCEALALGASWGLDPRVLSADVFANSSADCWAVRRYSPVPGAVDGAPANDNYRAGFGAPLMVKDLELALELAREAMGGSGAPAPLCAVAKTLYERVVAAAEARGEDPRAVDFSALYRDLYCGGRRIS